MSRPLNKLLLLLLFHSLSLACYGKSSTTDTAGKAELNSRVTGWMQKNCGLRFTENKGQMTDMQGNAATDLLFKTSSRGVDMYITKNGLSYVFKKFEEHEKASSLKISNPLKLARNYEPDNDSTIETYCRADMNLAGADIREENIIKEGESFDRADYYIGGICPNGVMNVHSYEKITIKNIYPGIDWVIYSGIKGLKYNFIVHPGADPLVIKLKYKWTDNPEIQKDGSLKINTPMGSIDEGKPVSFGEDTMSIPTTYVVTNNEIKFSVGNYDKKKILTIDPSLVWATYFAGSGNNGEEDTRAMQDDGSSVWVTGRISVTTFPGKNPGGGAYFVGSFPAGAYESAFILQFNIAGVLQWATYYGGNMRVQSFSIYSDRSNVYVAGLVTSTNYPTMNPGGGAYYQATLAAGSNENAFIMEFTTGGVRKWATYYGGNAAIGDYATSIQSDGTNVWVCGATSSKNFPVLNPGGGAYYQDTLAGTQSNAFISEFSTSGMLEWSTYYGASGYSTVGICSCANSIYSDGSNTYVTGYTSSASFPTLNPGGGSYFQGTIAGPQNVFVLQFNTSGVLKWGTTYGGSGVDIGNSIQSDGTSIWVTGQTTSTNFPLQNPGGGAYYQNTLGRDGNAFILQFDTHGVRKWATYYGGDAPNNNGFGEEGYSIQSDGKNVWVCGETEAPNFPTYNPSCGLFYQDTLGTADTTIEGSSPSTTDAFLLQFDTHGVRKWATYYGVDQNEDFSSDNEYDGCYASSDGTNLFIAGDAEFQGYPTVNPGGGAYYLTKLQAVDFEDVFMGKFCIACSSPIVALSSSVTMCQGNSTTLTASGGASYIWSTGTTTSSVKVSPTVTTTYTVGVTQGACTNDTSIVVTVNPIPTVALSGKDTICKGNSTTLIASGGTNYLWNTGTTTSSINVSPASSITYSVAVSSSGCIKDTTITVKVNALPAASISGNNTICLGDSTILTANGGIDFAWNNGATTSSINVSPPITTTYSVTVSNGNCSKGASMKVTVNTAPVPSISATNNVICIGSYATLTAGGGTIYNWSNGITFDTMTVAPKTTTTYSVNISNGLCSKDTSIIITVNTLPTVNINGVKTICAGASTTLTASGGTSYTWNTGATTSSITITPASTKTYSVNVSNGTCSKDTDVTVTVISYPVAGISGASPICAGNSTTLTASGGTIYTWNTGASTSTISVTPLSTSTYTVGVSNGTCVKDTNIVITVNPSPVTAINGTSQICAGTSTILTASGGTIYTWSTGATTSSINITPPSTNTYSVNISNGTCAKDTDITITVNPYPVAGISGTSPICAGNSTTLSASGGTIYTWNTGASASSIIVTPLSTTTYSVNISNGSCVKDTTIIIMVNPSPTVTIISTSPICKGSSTTLTAGGGTSYSWNNGETTSSITVSPTITTTYSINISNGSCAKDTSLVIAVDTYPVVGISGTNAICDGMSTALTASGGINYLWSTGATTGIINVSPLSTTTYSVNISNGTCQKDTSIIVTVKPEPVISVTATSPICAGMSTVLTASGGTNYVWNTGATTNSFNVHPNSTTTYSVTISNGLCSRDTNIQIIVNPLPVLTISGPQAICPGDTALLNSGGASSYIWNPSTGLNFNNIPNPIATPFITTTYTLTGTSAGCSVNDSVTIIIKDCDTIYVPNVFTPNGDGKNDFFLVTEYGLENYRIEIFNRWGMKVFESNNPAAPWDGKDMQGIMQSDGVYYYIINGSYPGNRAYKKEGFVQLIR
jgi:gliding motility-associated-like protein